jgi:hypothetical protein
MVAFQFSSDNAFMDNKLNEALDYLNQIGEAEKIMHDHNSYEAIFQIGYFVGFYTKNVNYSLLLQKNFHNLLGDLLDYLYIINEQYDFSKDNEPLKNAPLKTSTFNQRCTSLLFILLYLNNLIVNNYLEFLREFNKSKGLKAYISFLKDEKFIERNQNVENGPYNSIKLGLMNYVCLNLSRMSSDSSDFKHIFEEHNTVDALIKILKKLPKLELYISNILLNISDDKQIETFTEIHHISTTMIKQVHQCAKDFENNAYNRSNRQIFQNDQVVKIEFHNVKDSFGIITSFYVIIKGLYNLAINETLRKQIYAEPGIQKPLETILLKGNEEEQNLCLKLISQLTFNEDIAKDLKKYDTIIEFIDSQATHSLNDRIRKHCEQIKWNLKEKKKISKPVENEENSSEKTEEPGHIMISYNSASRELCLKVKSELEKRGFKVWMDVSDLHGSSLESMANAIENSVCMLMCVTEKYRKSVNCQAEAQYAFKLSKAIIPLIMQKGYENVSGWIGIIMGDKIFVNFTKYDYDECIRRLVHEVNSHYVAQKIKPISQPVVDNATNNSPAQSDTQQSIKKPENMKLSDVSEWFATNSIDPAIIQYFNSCDGSVLKQIYEMKKNDVEFYNQSLKSIPNISFISIAKFSAALEKLFQTN